MSRSISLLAVSVGVLFAACSVQIPDATYVCGPTEGCPNGFVCSEGLCRREAFDAGPVVDSDVDNGTEDGGNCAPETCNGSDDDCDGIVDDGVMSILPSVDVASTAGTFWSRFLAIPDGGFVVVSAIPDGPAGDNAIVASRYDDDGVLVVASVELARSSSSHIEAAANDTYFYVVRPAASGGDLMLDQFAIDTLARVDTAHTITATHASDVYDVVTENTVTADLAAVVYRDADDETHVQTVAVPAMNLESDQTIHTPTVEDPAFELASLVSAPCGRGLYAQLVRIGASPLFRIVPLGPTGYTLGDAYDVEATSPDVLYAFSRPIVVGGTCAAPPSELLIAWVEANTFSGTLEHTTLHVDTIGLTHSNTPPERTLTRTGGTSFEPANFINPAAAFTIHWPVALTRFADGRIFVGLSSTIAESSNGSVEVYELQPGFSERTLHETDAVPAAPLQLDFSTSHSSTSTFLLGGGRWTANGAAQFFKLGCIAE